MHNNINVNVSGPVQPASTYKTVVLKGNHSFASQVTETNMKYVIKHNFGLGGESVTIPDGCLLEFDGGSIKNGVVNCNKCEVIFNGYNGENLYNIKPGIRQKSIKIYYCLGGGRICEPSSVLIERLKIYAKRGFDGYVMHFSIDSNGNPLTSTQYPDVTMNDVYETLRFGDSIGFKCHALKCEYRFNGTIEDFDIGIAATKAFFRNIKDNYGVIRYATICGEHPFMLNPSGESADYIKSEVLSCKVYLEELGFNVLMLAADTQFKNHEYAAFKNYALNYLAVDFYPKIGGVNKEKNYSDVIEGIKPHYAYFQDYAASTGKDLIICEYGIRPFKEMFFNPANWNVWDNITYDANVPYEFWKGFFESPLSELSTEIWTFFTEYGNDKLFELFKSITGNK